MTERRWERREVRIAYRIHIGQRVRDQASERLRRPRSGPSSDFVHDRSLHRNVATAHGDADYPIWARFICLFRSNCNDMRGTTDTTVVATIAALNGTCHAQPSPEERLSVFVHALPGSDHDGVSPVTGVREPCLEGCDRFECAGARARIAR
jgi:hypothetical protein